MEMLSLEAIKEYRAQTFRTSAGLRLKSMAEAVGFINSCGFAFFWPNAERPLPSLWAAVAGDRPVPDEHDDPAHITWDWKDKALGQRLWYYGRVLAQRNAMISLALLPCFYALSPITAIRKTIIWSSMLPASSPRKPDWSMRRC